MKLFFSVGEPSGDLHGANLIGELRRRQPGLEAIGLGGPRMRSAGCALLRDMSDLAVMGLFPVLARLPEFLRLKRAALDCLDRESPDGVVLIDYPGFNWHIARAAKERGIPVFYYGLPQLWAWATFRVKKVQRYVDHALCKLPFEAEWFNSRGCQATYIGHPYFDELSTRQLDGEFIDSLRTGQRRLVTILPGSRTQEVKGNLPSLLRAARSIEREIPDVQFAVASYNDRQAELARRLCAAGAGAPRVFVGKTPELISAATCCLATSGSVSLELLYHAVPSVMVYHLPWWLYYSVRGLMNTRYMTLVNLLASDQPFFEKHEPRRPYDERSPEHEQVLFPEYPSWRDRSVDVARHATLWLRDETARQKVVARLATLREAVGRPGASARAAAYILNHLAHVQPAEAAGSPARQLRKAS
jgi:lipid-A-disaccharide synthase